MQDDTMRREGPIAQPQPIELVHEGMRVVDQGGVDLGKIEYVSMGDPQAVTTQGNEPPGGGPIADFVANALDEQREPDVPEPYRSQLIREGFLKIDGPGRLDRDRYVRSTLVASVTGNIVTLKVPGDRLVAEA